MPRRRCTRWRGRDSTSDCAMPRRRRKCWLGPPAPPPSAGAERRAGPAPAPGFDELLARFSAWRAEDRRGVTRFTDGLVKLFGSELPGLGLVRNFGLLLFDLSPAAQRALP